MPLNGLEWCVILIPTLSNTFSEKFEDINEGPFISYGKNNELDD